MSPEDLLPLRPVETLVLTMLASGERHGYGIRQDILEHSRGRIELEAGSLYPVESPLNCSSCPYFRECRSWTGPGSLKSEDHEVQNTEEAALCSSR